MIDDLLVFDPEELHKSMKHAKTIMRQFKVYDNVMAIDPEDPDLPDKEEYMTLKTLEDGLTAMHAVYNKLNEAMVVPLTGQRKNVSDIRMEEKKDIALLYSCYVGSAIISSKLKNMLASYDLEGARFLQQGAFKFDIEHSSITKLLSDIVEMENDFISFKSTDTQGTQTRFIRNGVDFANLTNILFKSLADYCVEKKESIKPGGHKAELVDIVDKFNFELFDTKISGFSSLSEQAMQDFIPILYEDVVGNTDLVDTLKKATDYLLNFDPKGKSNIMNDIGDYASKIFLKGPPGTGKTTTIQAFLYDTQRKAAEIGLEVEHIAIGNDIKDKYFGESVKKLKAKFDRVKKGDKLYVITIEDIDAIFAARDDPDASPAEKDILHELMNTLEGIGSSDLGNCVIISSSNLTSNERNQTPIDEALLGRIAEKEVEVLGPETQNDYARLLEIKLRKGINNGYISKDKFEDLGQLCYDGKVSGRGIKNIAKATMSYAQPQSFSPETFQITDPEEKKQALLNQFNKLGYDEIGSQVEQYIEHGKRNEEMMANQRKEKRIKQIINEIRAQEAAEKRYIEEDTEEIPIGSQTYNSLVKDVAAKVVKQILPQKPSEQ